MAKRKSRIGGAGWLAAFIVACGVAFFGYLTAETTKVAPAAAPVDTTPLTAVAVTQCSQLVVLYVTLPDGQLVRFDKSTGVPLEEVMKLAASARHSERVEVNCDKGVSS